MKNTLRAAAALGFALACGTVAADYEGWYSGIAAGHVKSGANASDFRQAIENEGGTNVVASVDNTDVGWKIFGGYKLSRHLAVEGAYVNFGEQQASATYDTLPGVRVDATTELDAFQLALVASLPVTGRLALFAKLGGYFWRADSTASTTLASISEEDDGKDVMFGLGASLKLADEISLRIEWERYDSDDDEAVLDLYTIGASLGF